MQNVHAVVFRLDLNESMEGEEVALIRPWNAALALEDPATSIAVFGLGGEKTRLIQQILHAVRNKVKSATAFVESTSAYLGIMPDAHVHAGFNEETLRQAVDRQRKAASVNATTCSETESSACVRPSARPPCWGLILDTHAYDRKSTTSGVMKYVVLNGHNDNIFYIHAMDWADITDILPQKHKIAIAFPFKNPEGVEDLLTLLREKLFDCFRTNEELGTVLKTLLPNEALVYERATHTDRNAPPRLFYVKVGHSVPKFRLGNTAYWQDPYLAAAGILEGPPSPSAASVPEPDAFASTRATDQARARVREPPPPTWFDCFKVVSFIFGTLAVAFAFAYAH